MLNRKFIIEELGLDEYCEDALEAYDEMDNLIKKLKPYKKKLSSREYVIFDNGFYEEYIKPYSSEKYKVIKQFYYPNLKGVTLFACLE